MKRILEEIGMFILMVISILIMMIPAFLGLTAIYLVVNGMTALFSYPAVQYGLVLVIIFFGLLSLGRGR